MISLHRDFRSMASDVAIDIAGPLTDITEKLDEAVGIFASIEASCSRFNPASPLMIANSDPHNWHSLPQIAVNVIRAGYEAYIMTEGAFDPRILNDLVRHGYDENRQFDSTTHTGVISTPRQSEPGTRKLSEWHPEFGKEEVLLGDLPIDLGGIGKGFAVQKAMEILQDCAEGVLINAGGDIAAEGYNEDGTPWRLGVENPWDAAGQPVLVVELVDVAIATSSTRMRSWFRYGRPTHHLIDPTTGSPGGRGLVAVSAIAAVASLAEVWSKSLFLKGIDGIKEIADQRSIAAAWIDESGTVSTNEGFQELCIWGIAQAPVPI